MKEQKGLDIGAVHAFNCADIDLQYEKATFYFLAYPRSGAAVEIRKSAVATVVREWSSPSTELLKTKAFGQLQFCPPPVR